jgi:hypothetical protein
MGKFNEISKSFIELIPGPNVIKNVSNLLMFVIC